MALDNMELEMAKQYAEKALKIDRKFAPALELKALILLEEGKVRLSWRSPKPLIHRMFAFQ